MLFIKSKKIKELKKYIRWQDKELKEISNSYNLTNKKLVEANMEKQDLLASIERLESKVKSKRKGK